MFLHLYLNIYYASDSASCIICPRILIVQLKQQVLLPATSVSSPRVGSPRVGMSMSCPVTRPHVGIRQLGMSQDTQSAMIDVICRENSTEYKQNIWPVFPEIMEDKASHFVVKTNAKP